MATYNGGKHIKEQLDSILCQDLSAYPDAEMEIIISDDGSTDEPCLLSNNTQTKG